MIEELKKAGLTENEAKVYLSLIDIGPSLAGTISRKTGLHRRTVYDTTEMLIEKGLLSYILENRRRLFKAVNPYKIIENLQEKQNLLSPIVSSLQVKFNETKVKEETNFYRGKEGLKSVFEDQLNYKEVLILGASIKAYEVLQFYFKWYDKKRKEKKIKARIIAQDKKIKSIPLSDIRYLPQKYTSPVSVNIYGNNVSIILWEKDKPLAIVIKNDSISKGYRNYFELMWKIAKA